MNLSTLPEVQFAGSRVTYPTLMEMGAPLRIEGEDEDLGLNHQDAGLSQIQEEGQESESRAKSSLAA